MGTEITTQGVSVVTLATSRPASLAFHRNGLTIDLGEPTIASDRAPTETQRSALLSRAAQLKAALSPSTNAESVRAILAMVSGMPSQSADPAAVKLRGEAFSIATDDLPAWAVASAARRFIRGETPHGKTYCPSPAIFREYVLNMLAEWRSELELVEHILKARVVDPPPAIHREPMPGRLKWTDIQEGERVGFEPEPARGSHATEAFLGDLRARMERSRLSRGQGEAA